MVFPDTYICKLLLFSFEGREILLISCLKLDKVDHLFLLLKQLHVRDKKISGLHTDTKIDFEQSLFGSRI